MWQAMSTQDIHWSEDALRAGKKFLNKVWNSGRFILARIGSEERALKRPKPILPHTQRVMAAFDTTSEKIKNHIEVFEFGPALHALYDFYWHEFCDVFLEESKKDESPETLQTLLYIFASSLKLAHPFTPFVTEKLWGFLPLHDIKLLIVEEV